MNLFLERYYNYFLQEELDDIINQTEFKIETFYKKGLNENYTVETINRNHAIWASYEPGSTFKIATTLLGIFIEIY